MSSLYSILKVNVENGGETDYDWILFHYPAFLDQNTIPFILDLIILTSLLKHSRRITNDDNCLHTYCNQCCGAVTFCNDPDPSPRIRTTDFLSVTSRCQQKIIFIKKSQNSSNQGFS